MDVNSYLYTGAWQICDCKSGSCFGIVGGTIRLDGSTAIRLLFDLTKTYSLDSEDDFVIALPEAYARVLADELTALFARCDYLYKLYKQERLTPDAIYSDMAEFPPDETNASMNLTGAPLCREIEIERKFIYDQEGHVDVGSVSAFGPKRGSGMVESGSVEIRLSKKAVRRVTVNHDSLDVEIPRRFTEQLSECVRAAVVELSLLRSLVRDEWIIR